MKFLIYHTVLLATYIKVMFIRIEVLFTETGERRKYMDKLSWSCSLHTEAQMFRWNLAQCFSGFSEWIGFKI